MEKDINYFDRKGKKAENILYHLAKKTLGVVKKYNKSLYFTSNNQVKNNSK